MNNIFKKIYAFIFLLCISLSITGCSDKGAEVDISNTTTEVSEDVDYSKEGLSSNILLTKKQYNEEKKTDEYVSAILEPIVYNGDDIELYVNFTLTNGGRKNVSLTTLLAIDNQIIPFSIENGQMSKLNRIDATCSKKNTFKITFNPKGYLSEKSLLTIIAIPFTEHNSDTYAQTYITENSAYITTTTPDTSLRTLDYSVSQNLVTEALSDVKSRYNNDLSLFKMLDEYTYLPIFEGKGTFVVSNNHGSYTTYIICNDEIVKVNGDKDCFVWELDGDSENPDVTDTQNVISYEFDSTNLEKGSTAYSISLLNDFSDYSKYRIFKSANVEVK